jgi:hypothetical protein
MNSNNVRYSNCWVLVWLAPILELLPPCEDIIDIGDGHLNFGVWWVGETWVVALMN